MGLRVNGFGRTLPTDFFENVHRVFATPADIPSDYRYGTVYVDYDNLRAYMLIQYKATGSAQAIRTFDIVEFSPDHKGNRPVASATNIGDKIVNVTNTGVAATANQFAGGQLLAVAGTGLGRSFRIGTHPAAAGNASIRFTVPKGLDIELDTTTRFDVLGDPFRNAVIGEANAAGNIRAPGGIAVSATSYSSSASPSAFVVVDGIYAARSHEAVTDANNDGTPIIKDDDGEFVVQTDTDTSRELGIIIGNHNALAANDIVPVSLTFGPRFILG